MASPSTDDSASGAAGADEPERRPSGRPRGPSSATQYAVLSAAWRILTDDGITALTPTRLHAETGVARTTIYRHWPDAASVVADIVAGASQRRVPTGTSGDLRTDLLAALETLTFRLRHRPIGPLLGALLAGEARAAAESPTSADYVGALIAPIRDVLVDAVATGAVRTPADPDDLLRALVGPMLLDVLLLGGDPEAIDDAAVVDDFLARHRARSGPLVPPMLQPDVVSPEAGIIGVVEVDSAATGNGDA